MSDLALAKDAAYHRQMARDETIAARRLRRAAEVEEERAEGWPEVAARHRSEADSCERRARLWTQLADKVQAYLDERAVPDPRLL